MALIEVSYGLLDDDECFEALIRAFDSIKEIEDRRYSKTKIMRVQHNEITKEDKLISPSFYKFEGVIPFLIEFDQ